MEEFAPGLEQFPVYPMREQVSFPHMVFPLFVGKEEVELIDAHRALLRPLPGR